MTDDIREAVSRLYAAYARGDVDTVVGLIHDDIDWMIHGPMQALPFVGHRRGRPAVLDVIAAIGRDYALQRYQPEAVIVEGDRAAVMSDTTFVQRATGRTLRFRIADFLRFRDGKVVEFREFADTFDLVEQARGREFDL